jgi:hypothetical protein
VGCNKIDLCQDLGLDPALPVFTVDCPTQPLRVDTNDCPTEPVSLTARYFYEDEIVHIPVHKVSPTSTGLRN